MITKFDSSYYGTVDMENLGYAGTPINERRYSQAELGGALHKVVEYAKCMDERGYDTFWMAEQPFPAGRHGADPESADDGDALVRGDEEPAHRLRLQRRADAARVLYFVTTRQLSIPPMTMPAPTLFQNEAANLTRSLRCSVELLSKCSSSRISVLPRWLVDRRRDNSRRSRRLPSFIP